MSPFPRAKVPSAKRDSGYWGREWSFVPRPFSHPQGGEKFLETGLGRVGLKSVVIVLKPADLYTRLS